MILEKIYLSRNALAMEGIFDHLKIEELEKYF